jgi:hypothetical protein
LFNLPAWLGLQLGSPFRMKGKTFEKAFPLG